jgi:uncharacterized repeat protein (TIGR01451 family)
MRKSSWAVTILTSLALGLVACPQPVKPPDTPLPAQKASLEIVVQGIAQAGIQISHEGSSVFDGVVVGSKTLDLDAGAYILDGKPVGGYQDPSPVTITLGAGQSVRAVMIYQQVEPPSAPVAKLEIVSVKDGAGIALPGQKEDNANKIVQMFASQTEEPVCVSLKAMDASGAPVKGASLVVSTNEVFGEHIAVIRGCPTSAQTANLVRPMAFRDGIITDANGLGVFTLYATFGGSTSSPTDTLLLMNQPAKIVVAAENTNGSAVLEEMKAFFYNISHLYFNGAATTQRTGKVFPEETNLFKPLDNRVDRGDPRANEFLVGASLFTKQPQQTIKLPSPLFNFKFEMTSGSDKVGFVPGSFETAVSPTVVFDKDGSVRIEPLESLGLRDLPVSATVKVTLITRYAYGNTTYEFPLKDFTITKRWIGSYLSITKSVDHHVLSWAGPQHHLHYGVTPPDANDHTLAAKNDPAVTAGSVFTATYTLKLKNEGKDAAYNISLADAIPAELGVIESTFSPAGATYDGTSHVVTWNWQNTPDPRFDKLDPGQEIIGSFQVYLRQKPGFAWDQNDLMATRYYQVQPISRETYPDPYKLVNGIQTNDVTGTWYTGAQMDKGGYQMLVDFNGGAFEKDVVIWGVRPIFSVEKKLVSPGEQINVGQIAYFDLSIANLERVPRYDAVKGAYPDEFNGKSRDNPYGRNVRVTDVFDTGLDFVSATPLAVTDDESVTAPSSYNPVPVPDKGIVWEIVPVMGGGDTGKAQIALRGNLPSPGMVAPTSNLVQCMPNPFWYNCAFLDADNLNQPADLKGADWKQYELRPHAAAPLHQDWLVDLRYGIRACAKIEVVLKGEPWIELTSIGENDLADPNGATNLIGVHQNQGYSYFMSVLNHGGATAANLSFTMTLSGGNASFSTTMTDHAAFVSTNGGLTWTFAFNASTATTTSVSFPMYDLPQSSLVLYSVRTTADLVGDAKATGTATYSNPVMQTPFLPAIVMEDTQIQP